MKFKQGRISLDLKLQKKEFFFDNGKKDLGENKSKISPSEYFLTRTDPRPLYDKNYISGCIRDIFFFLSKKGYDINFGQNLLRSPISKDFFNILSFLLNQFDENFDFKKKIEENYTIILKELSYPFPLPKGTRYIIGSPHLWPNLLACLKWLVELLQYDALMQEEKNSGYKSSIKKEKNIWEQLSDSYFYFLNASGRNKKFSKTLYCLVKTKINETKILNFQKIKKLRTKYRNFHGAKNAFMLSLISDKNEFLNKRIFITNKARVNFTSNFFYSKNSVFNNFFVLKERKFLYFLNSKLQKRKIFEKSTILLINRIFFFFFNKFSFQNILLKKILIKTKKKIEKYIYLFKKTLYSFLYFAKIFKIISKKKILSSIDNKKTFSLDNQILKHYFTKKFNVTKEEDFVGKNQRFNLIFYKNKNINVQFLSDLLEIKIFKRRENTIQQDLNFDKKIINFKKILKEKMHLKKILNLDLFESKKKYFFAILSLKLKKIKNIIFKKHIKNNLIFQIFSLIFKNVLAHTRYFLICLFK